MVHIYTFCDKTLVGKTENKSANLLCENLYKMNFIIDEVCTYPSSFNYENLTLKNNHIYFLLMQKTNVKLNTFLSKLSSCELTINETLKKVVNETYSKKNLPLEKETENEWLIPSCAIPITNPNGNTQGYLLKIAETTIFVLPNNYTEFYSVYNDCLLKYLEDNYPVEYPEPVSTTEVLRLGYNVEEIPVSMNERENGVSSIKAWKNVYYMVNVILSIVILGLGVKKNEY